MALLRKVVQIILLDDEEQQFAFWLVAEGEAEQQLPAYRLQRAVLGDDGRVYVRTFNPQAGQLPASKGTLHTAMAGAQTIIERLHLSNLGSGNNTVQIYLKRSGGSSREIFRAVLKANQTLRMRDLGTLNEGELVEGVATNASEVDYDLTVREETPL